MSGYGDAILSLIYIFQRQFYFSCVFLSFPKGKSEIKHTTVIKYVVVSLFAGNSHGSRREKKKITGEAIRHRIRKQGCWLRGWTKSSFIAYGWAVFPWPPGVLSFEYFWASWLEWRFRRHIFGDVDAMSLLLYGCPERSVRKTNMFVSQETREMTMKVNPRNLNWFAKSQRLGFDQRYHRGLPGSRKFQDRCNISSGKKTNNIYISPREFALENIRRLKVFKESNTHIVKRLDHLVCQNEMQCYRNPSLFILHQTVVKKYIYILYTFVYNMSCNTGLCCCLFCRRVYAPGHQVGSILERDSLLCAHITWSHMDDHNGVKCLLIPVFISISGGFKGGGGSRWPDSIPLHFSCTTPTTVGAEPPSLVV